MNIEWQHFNYLYNGVKKAERQLWKDEFRHFEGRIFAEVAGAWQFTVYGKNRYDETRRVLNKWPVL